MIMNKFYILDLETTGLEKNPKILSISLYIIEYDEIVHYFNIRTDVPCPPKHISYEHLKDIGKLTEIESVQLLTKIITRIKWPIMGWGLFYETGVLKRYGLNLKRFKLVDMMVIFRKALKLKKNPSLDSMSKKYKIESEYPLHTGLGDIDRTFKLYKILTRR